MTYKDKLEELLKEFEIYGDLDGIQDIKTYMKAIENMLNRNKELEEENSLLIQQNITYKRNIHDLKNKNIPVSLVKEKIEELNKLLEEDLQDERKVNSNRFIIICQCKNCLQELLEKRE